MLSSEASLAQSAGRSDIPLQELPSEAEKGELFDVIVVNVRSPSKFFVQLKSQYSALSAMMDALDEAMEEALLVEQFDSSLPAVPKTGLYVAARWPRDEKWYRTKVVGIASNTHATLSFIDYGDVCDVLWKSVRRLPPSFEQLPAQALQAKLLGVQPNSKVKAHSATWGSASKVLQRATGNSSARGVWALMTSRDRRTGKMGLWLLDTANNDEPEGIWVHEQLLEQGLVQPCPADSLARQLVVKPRVEALVEEVENYFRSKGRGHLQGLELSRSLCYLEQKLHHLCILANLEDAPQGQMSTSVGESEEMIRKPKFVVEKHQLVLPTGAIANFSVAIEEGGKAWVVGRDVSALVPEWRGYDLFENRLKARGLTPDVRRLTKAEDGFEDLRQEGLIGEGDEEVLLYSLEDLALVLTRISQNAATVIAGLWNSTRRG